MKNQIITSVEVQNHFSFEFIALVEKKGAKSKGNFGKTRWDIFSVGMV